MSEFINNTETRVEQLLQFSLGVMNGENVSELIIKYRTAIDHITPHDMLMLEDKQMQMGFTPTEIKKDVEKVINTFYKGLLNYQWQKPQEGNFLYYLMLENKAYKYKLNQTKKILKKYKGKEKSSFIELKNELLPAFTEFQQFESHYLKKENILFPHLEKIWKNYRPLTVMWSLHDDIRAMLKNCITMLKNEDSEWTVFSKLLGKFYFAVFGMIQKEDLIVFPVAVETVDKQAWKKMQGQSFEFPFAFIETPEQSSFSTKNDKLGAELQKNIQLISDTGNLEFEQALMLFNALPIDITYVDEQDKVVFFNQTKDRLFPRSSAIIGRAVQNCHPPESVHVVNQILDSFREGVKDQAEFWINMKGHFIYIRYFALRNKNGEYKGVLEVSQDITTIRMLDGEKRLLDWNH